MLPPLGVAATAVMVAGAQVPVVVEAQTRHDDSRITATNLPLKATRTARFEVTEGTWMSVDVSPDGRTIIFDLLGDLYTLPITGGKAKRLTYGTALNGQPRYSPDGSQVAFVSDRGGSGNLWIADRDGRNPRQLSNLHFDGSLGAVTSPTWSPDGRTIVVSQRLMATRRQQNDHGYLTSLRWLLAAYDAHSGRMRWVSDTTPYSSGEALGPAFAADGQLYASVDAIRKDLWREPAGWRVSRVDLATGRSEPAVGATAGIGAPVSLRPALSPDGRYLVYAMPSGSRLGFRIRDLHSDRERWLAREVLDHPPLAEPAGYVFTPDSKSLIAAYGGKVHRIDVATGRTSLIPFVADVARPLGTLGLRQFSLPDTAVRTRSVLQPSISPEGNRVAFSALDRIWVMELPADGHTPRAVWRLTGDSIGEFYPSWSPDGQWVIYSTWQDSEGGAVRRARVSSRATTDSSPPERLTSDTAAYFHTAVTADGERVVAVRATVTAEGLLSTWRLGPESFQVVWLPVSRTGNAQKIGSMASAFSELQYPVDQLYFTADPSRLFVGLRSWSWQGQQTSDLAIVGQEWTGGGTADRDFAGTISPDGRRAFVTRQYTLFELTLPSGGRNWDSLDLDYARTRPAGAAAGAAHRWGSAWSPWITWSRDGRRVLFGQGGTLFVGRVRPGAWTNFERVDVSLAVPVDIPHGVLVLRGARLITMRGREVIERGDLVIRDNRIVALGPFGHVAIPESARILDLSGRTILPGYVDLHEHPRLALGVHPQGSWEQLVRLAHGVTAWREAAGWGSDVFTYRERERAGDLLGPRIFSTGISYYGTDPPVQTLDDARERVRVNSDYFGAETFKVYWHDRMDRRTRQLLAMAMVYEGLNATTHTDAIDNELSSVIDGFSGIEHPPQIPIYEDVAGLTAFSGTTHTHTYFLNPGAVQYMVRHRGGPWSWPGMRRFIPPGARGPATVCPQCTAAEIPVYGPPELDYLIPLLSGAAKLAAKGGRVGIGSHGEVPGIGYHYEMWLHAMGGMPNHEILRSATIRGSAALGHASDFGSLEPGKLADLQILDRDPLADIHNTATLCYVMKNGRLYQAQDLAEVWPRHRLLPPLYTWDATRRPDLRETAPSAGGNSDSSGPAR